MLPYNLSFPFTILDLLSLFALLFSPRKDESESECHDSFATVFCAASSDLRIEAISSPIASNTSPRDNETLRGSLKSEYSWGAGIIAVGLLLNDEGTLDSWLNNSEVLSVIFAERVVSFRASSSL